MFLRSRMSHYGALAITEAMKTRLVLNSQIPSSLCFMSDGIKDVHHHTW